MSKLDEFLELLKDGTWTNLTGIAETLKLTLDKLEKTAETLAKQDLIRYNPEAKKVKISPEWIALLGEEENQLHKPTTATIIIPPKETFNLQNLHITNVTDQELELWIKTCRELTEIVVNKID